MTENKNRVCCLYRVSTDKQVDFNSNHEADLPMQRKACHKFAEAKGWVIVHEEQEEGVSGHKVRAEARDKLQIIKEYSPMVLWMIHFASAILATENSASRRIAPGRPATPCTFWTRSSTRWFVRFSPA